MEENRRRRVVVSGHAIVPQGTVLYETKRLITIALEIDWDTGIILKAESAFITTLCDNFFSQLVEGYNLVDDYDIIRNRIQREMYVDSKKALLKAFSVVYERFQSLKMNEFAHLKDSIY